MPPIRECPKCDGFMEYQEGEADVGISPLWECPKCGHTELDDYGDEPELVE